MTQSRSPSPGRTPPRATPDAPRPSRSALRPLLVGAALLALIPQAAVGQSVPPSQAQGALQQALQQNPQLPEILRQRIQQSGLTPEQIRARLRASGYPENLLDAYPGTGAAPQAGAQPGAAELAAIQALGLAPPQPAGAALPVDTGLIRIRGDTLAPRSRVFGVDVFRRSTTQFLPLLSGPVPA